MSEPWGSGSWSSFSTGNTGSLGGYVIVPQSEYIKTTPPPPWFSSKEHGEAGDGFPSTCVALARMPRNTNDANNYYITIGLWPWADQKTIKRRCRALLAKYHPEGTAPSPNMFERIEEIYRILTDPVRQEIYHSVPPGARYIDRFVKQELFDQAHREGKDISDFTMPAPGNVEDLFEPDDPDDDIIDADPDPDPEVLEVESVSLGNWDYYAEVPVSEDDHETAQRWYDLLLPALREEGYEGPIKIVLTNGGRGFSRRSSLVRVPRTLDPIPDNTPLVTSV